MRISFPIGSKSTARSITNAAADNVIISPAATEYIERAIQNYSASPLFLKRGSTCTSTNYDFVIPAGSGTPDGKIPPVIFDNYYGPITGSSAGAFACRVAELFA